MSVRDFGAAMCNFRTMDDQKIIAAWVRDGLNLPGKTQTALAEAIGLERPRVSEILNGKRRVQLSELIGMAEYFGKRPPKELLEKLNHAGADDEQTDHVRRILDAEAETNGYHDGWRPALKGGIPQLDATGGLGDGSVGQVVQIDNGGITSGHLVTDEWVIPRSVLSISNLSVFALPVDGTSMEPGLKTDDVVFVDTRPRGIKNDEVYVIDEGSGPEVKRLSLDRGSDPPVIVISSDNPAASTRRRPADSVRVIGRVVGKFVKMASY